MKDDRKKEIISELSDGHKDEMKGLAKRLDKDLKELLSEFCELFDAEDTTEEYPEDCDARIKYVMNVLRARTAFQSSRPIEEVKLHVIGTRSPRTGERQDGSKYTVSGCVGIVEREDGEEVLVNVTTWGEHADKVNQIKHGESYKLKMERQEAPATATVVPYEFGSFTKPVATDYKPSSIVEVLRDAVPYVKIADARQNVSTDRGDWKMIRGIIQDIQMLTTDDGRKLGRIEIYDSSLDYSDAEREGLFPVMAPADMVKYGPDSDVIFIGNITNNEEYGLGMFANAVVAKIPVEYEADGTQVTEDSVDVEDADDMAVATVDEEEVEEGDKFEDLMT